MSTGDLVTRVYGNFRGVDFRGEEINLSRSPDCLNVWKDYKETDRIRTRPGMKLVQAFEKPVHGIFFRKQNDGTDQILVHSGASLFEDDKYDGWREEDDWSGILGDKSVAAFQLGSSLFMLTGEKYLLYDGEIYDVLGYAPTTSIGRKPAGGGTIHEDVNLLTGERINTFLVTERAEEFYLDAQNIDTDFLPMVWVDGENLKYGDDFVVDYAAGKITLRRAPEPVQGNQDNVLVRFRKTVPGARAKIEKCTIAALFDNRVFFGGNPDYPNMMWHSSLNDPTYVSDLDYYREGTDQALIRGIVPGNNALWVFREPSGGSPSVFYHVPTIDADYGKIYPSQHSSVSTGCVGKAINFNDDIVFFSSRGMEGISGDITTEQALGHRSSMADRKLTAEEGYKDMILEEWEGYLLVFMGKKCYLADSRSAVNNNGHMEYEWFYWEMEKEITCTRVHNGILYLGTADGVYTLTDNEKPLTSYWVTPKDKFKYPNRQKTTNKRGCVAEATGDISVYAKTDKTDFELIGTYEDVADYFVSRIKRKKFKDIQLKFCSETRFSLETVTLECFIGGYIKR